MQTSPLTLHALPALETNYIWVMTPEGETRTAVVDPGNATPVIHYFEHGAGRERTLDYILLTHHHHDHTDGVEALVSRYNPDVIGPGTIAQVTTPVSEGDTFDLLGAHVQVIATPGHTLDHVVYLLAGDPPILLTGDTVFMAGCGRLFEGTAEQMQANFARLRELPDDTLIYGAHEYTQANLAFAQTVEPANRDINQAIGTCAALAHLGRPTLPTRMGVERSINPFMRFDEESVQQAVHERFPEAPDDNDPVTIFALLRDWKDRF